MKEIFTSNNIAIVCVTLLLVSIVGAFTHYHVNDRGLMSKNIEQALSAGINPLAVRCTYARTDDAVCVAYAFSGKTSVEPIKK